ncbi:mediator of RNA polymerase II transcription [Trichuris trichiura]|uniref:Mediator of RNA polymerase II transcription subunit 4 n=1 Tax=Trichuris trichiura TaxID=36087 RepID=A0A077Z632_TRITR|nr:mediator of RNA polymerase II transcription [Trichuris trichiura]
MIDSIQHDIEVRNEYIDRLRGCLLEAESILASDFCNFQLIMNAIFQANLKLRSIKQADLRPVSADDLVRYAHRISAANSVTAPLTWQQGDPERPFPTDLEMRSGWLSRITGGAEFSAPISTLAHPPVMSSHMVSVDSVHAITLPSQSDVSPVASQKLGPSACWPSPRSTYMPSPRARLPNACVSPGCVAPIGQRTVRTPAVHNQAIKRDIGTAVEDAVEVLSSDSSSSSSSDSPS